MMGVKQRNTGSNADHFCIGQSVSTQLTHFALKNPAAANVRDGARMLTLGSSKSIRCSIVAEECRESGKT